MPCRRGGGRRPRIPGGVHEPPGDRLRVRAGRDLRAPRACADIRRHPDDPVHRQRRAGSPDQGRDEGNSRPSRDVRLVVLPPVGGPPGFHGGRRIPRVVDIRHPRDDLPQSARSDLHRIDMLQHRRHGGPAPERQQGMRRHHARGPPGPDASAVQRMRGSEGDGRMGRRQRRHDPRAPPGMVVRGRHVRHGAPDRLRGGGYRGRLRGIRGDDGLAVQKTGDERAH